MIKILSVSGSPVENSSTDFILNKIAESLVERLKSKVEVSHDFIKLNDIKFIPCQACGKTPEPDYCFYDELNEVYKLLEECDCLLFGSPVYFDSVSAQSKLFIDRCNCFRPPDYSKSNSKYSFIKRLRRKRPGAIILVRGENGYFEGARRVIAGFFKWVEVINEGLITYQSTEFTKKETVRNDKNIINEIEQLTQRLVESLDKKNG